MTLESTGVRGQVWQILSRGDNLNSGIIPAGLNVDTRCRLLRVMVRPLRGLGHDENT
jgi:hypothetical protein